MTPTDCRACRAWLRPRTRGPHSTEGESEEAGGVDGDSANDGDAEPPATACVCVPPHGKAQKTQGGGGGWGWVGCEGNTTPQLIHGLVNTHPECPQECDTHTHTRSPHNPSKGYWRRKRAVGQE